MIFSPCRFSEGSIERLYVLYWASTSSWVPCEMAVSCSFGVSPAISFLVYFACTISFSEATRIMMNSSRFEAVMLKNFSRSMRGMVLSFASDKIR